MLPTVGSSPRGRNTAVPARNANAFAFAVENAAVPPVSVTPALPDCSLQVAWLDAISNNRAAPARTCKFPCVSVLRLSPLNTVVPTDAAAVSTNACCVDAETTVPKPTAEFAGNGIITKLKLRRRATPAGRVARRRAISSPRGPGQEYLAPRMASTFKPVVRTQSKTPRVFTVCGRIAGSRAPSLLQLPQRYG